MRWICFTLAIIVFICMDQEQAFSKSSNDPLSLKIDTELELAKVENEYEYQLVTQASTETKAKMYEQSSLTLVFENSHLSFFLEAWEPDTDKLKKLKTTTHEGSRRFDAWTKHQLKTKNLERATAISSAQLYTTNSPHTNIHAFTQPKNDRERKGRYVLDHVFQQQLLHEAKQLRLAFDIPKDIPAISWNHLNEWMESGPKQLSDREAKQVVTTSWHMYRDHILEGVKREDGTLTTPIGSSMPIIVLDEEDLHLLLMLEDGTPYKLTHPWSFEGAA
ncbi:hypothetical protein [Salsuginibacillus kocurii]|uniref:hypothetical protein n=1 Tax=Salsuginibacillus kocurii TaxID=427078 RepID=UPI00036EA79E|nr:hypothetical protein [Salsuginibacillus kocurii]